MREFLSWNFLLFLLPIAVAKPGFLFTSPRTFISEENVTVWLTLYDVPGTGSFKISLVKQNGNTTETLTQITQSVDKPSPASGQMFKIDIEVPRLQRYSNYPLVVEGAVGEYVFYKKADMSISSPQNKTIIQTDKAIYKCGQLVRWRILTLDYQLKPVQKTGDVWIENPNGVRMVQWLAQNFSTGMSQYAFQLPEVSDFGTWTIFVKFSNPDNDDSQTTSTTFDIAEYVLPKFEVVIKNPSFILRGDKTATWNICGRYTYGKMVRGNLSVKAGIQSWGYWDGRKYPSVYREQRIDGCTDFTINLHKMRWNHDFSDRGLNFFAKITEDGTDVEQNSSSSIFLTSQAFTVRFSYPSDDLMTFKPGMPFVGQVSVSNPDNTGRSNESIQICALPTTQELTAYHHRTDTYLFCKNYTSDEKGIVSYTVLPSTGNAVNLKIQADALGFSSRTADGDDDGQSALAPASVSLHLKPWYSSAKRYIQILPLLGEVDCGTTQLFTVYLNGQDGDIFNLYHQVLSTDGIISQDSSKYEYSAIKTVLPVDDTYVSKSLNTKDEPETDTVLGIVSLAVDVTPEMSPTGNLLVYYIRPDGEIIADSLTFNIKKCMKHKVGMMFTSEKELPGKNVGIKVTASPYSLCGIEAIDKSVSLLGSDSSITPEKISDLLYSARSYLYGEAYDSGTETCKTAKAHGPSTFLRRRRSTVSPPYGISTGYVDAYNAFQNGRFWFLTDLDLVTKPCEEYSGPFDVYPMAFEGTLASYEEDGEYISTTATYALMGRLEDSDREYKYKPEVLVRDYFPDTWLWEMDSTNDKGEVVLKRELPQTITEWKGKAVCLSSEDGLGVSQEASVITFQNLFVSMTLPSSATRGEVVPLTISISSYFDNCLPIQLQLDKSNDFTLVSSSWETKFCVCGGDIVTHKYLVKPTTLGQVNFTSRAFTDTNADICGDQILSNVTASDGATNSLVLQPEGFPHQEAFSNFFCPTMTNGTFRVEYDLVPPSLTYVPDSGRAEFLVTGDLMGHILDNLQNLIQMPTGCGEQNMLNFVPDINVLGYLTTTDKLKPETKTKLLDYIQTGYQRELTYRHDDGSYSAFGEYDSSGSMWLSAFVVKAYQQASNYVFVDKAEISGTLRWINAQQDKDGCYPQVGEVHSRAMQGGSGSNLGSKATLTSYVLISILEADLNRNETSVKHALSCLHKEKNPTTYTLALMTYASCLAQDPAAQTMLENLMKLRKMTGAGEYWEDDSTNSASIRIEIASYAVLSLFTCAPGDYIERAFPIIHWILKQSNTNGGFISTQDTVMAVQALSLYSSHLDKKSVDISVVMTAQGLNRSMFQVNEKNKILVQYTKLPQIPTKVVVEANGAGCALVQSNLFYNVEVSPDFQAFWYNISTAKHTNKNCTKEVEVTTCMNYNYRTEASSMAVLEINLSSGYEPVKDTLDKLKEDDHLFLKRYDIDERKVSLYFTKVVSKKRCFSFTVTQEFVIDNLQKSTSKLYEYYQPENQVSQAFSIDQSC